jgi:glucuronate isomerase
MAASVRPSLRGDDILAVDSPGYVDWVQGLGSTAGVEIVLAGDLFAALVKRLGAFGQLGCRLADHALDRVEYLVVGEDETAALFEKRLCCMQLNESEILRFRSGILRWLASQYRVRGWTMQLHIGAQRYTSSRLRALAGAAGGYATAGSACDVAKLCTMLDDFEKHNALPRTILYTLNPADNAAFATLTGSYAQDNVPGKVQFGPAWWYNDHIMGVRNHLEALTNYGLLATFIGMTTDSRSLLSLSRHEYFRRTLCQILGEWLAADIMPDDPPLLEELVKGVCYANAKRYLDV